jgi:phosphate starvation-inducible PhoH-like protein
MAEPAERPEISEDGPARAAGDRPATGESAPESGESAPATAESAPESGESVPATGESAPESADAIGQHVDGQDENGSGGTHRGRETVTSVVDLESDVAAAFLGVQDRNLRRLEEAFPQVRWVARSGRLNLSGPGSDVNRALEVVSSMMGRLKTGEALTDNELDLMMEEADRALAPPTDYQDETVLLTTNKRRIFARTVGQYQYLQSIEENDIVFSIGPAGTGKTYLAVAMAVRALSKREVQRIVLARPAVEAGESLGFLPGDLREKVDPYLRPLYDALYDMIPSDRLHRYLDTHTIEVVPLAFMSGRTMNNAFVILDEAQNTTTSQMKMFLTRLGVNSKAIVTGDVTQVDLPSEVPSGLVQIQNILMGIDQIAFIYLSDRDVVRHRLVREIIRAYEEKGL